MTNKYIICCDCSHTPEFSKDAFSLLFPGEEIPEMIVGKDKLLDLINELPESNFRDYVSALYRTKNKFSYYFAVENFDIKEQWNLLKGVQVAV